MALGQNRVLGCANKSEATRPHRVALGNWPAMVDDARVKTFDAFIGFLQTSGYEGTEFGPGYFSKYLPGDSPTVVARKARQRLEAAGLHNFGATLYAHDNTMRQYNWLDQQREDMLIVQESGGEFVNYQIMIHPDHANTGGAYREDEGYLRWCAARFEELRDLAWSLGMNFYLEVHVDRITEDPAALCRMLELCTVELNGDMSHYLCRGFTKGKHVDRIMSLMGHTHVRMARKYGDLSAVVEDPKANWEAKGETWQMFQFMKAGLDGGLSSRCIVGETGPAFLVKDTLTQDAALVPLYRAMARYADASAQGIAMKVDEPGDLNPWG